MIQTIILVLLGGVIALCFYNMAIIALRNQPTCDLCKQIGKAQLGYQLHLLDLCREEKITLEETNYEVYSSLPNYDTMMYSWWIPLTPEHWLSNKDYQTLLPFITQVKQEGLCGVEQL